MSNGNINFAFSTATYHIRNLPEDRRKEVLSICKEKGVTCSDFTSEPGSGEFNMWIELSSENITELKSDLEKISEN